MKKFLLLIGIMAFMCTAQGESDIHSFSYCLKNCEEYFSTQTISLPSMSLTTKREILGLDKENLCQYRETISSNNSVYTVNCKFNKEQRTSLAKVISDFDDDSQNNNIDINDFNQVQNSSVYGAWAEYLQDGSICSIDAK